MMSWNPEARELFDRHCEDRRDALLAAGADPDEVYADWRELVETHAAAKGEAEVGPARVRAELADLFSALNDLPAAAPAAAAVKPARIPAPVRTWFRRGITTLLWIFGVALPLGVLGFELVAGFCAETLFDPLPTWLHVLLVALVPVANAWALLAAAGTGRARPVVGVLNGAAIGIAAYYALQFAVPTPFAFIAVIWFGIGLLPLAPLLSFFCALLLRRRLRLAAARRAERPPVAAWRSALPAFLLLVALSIPQLIVPLYTPLANDSDPVLRAHAVKILRWLGSREVLLRRCYRATENIDLSSLLLSGSFELGRSIPREDAQNAYYRVTGTPYNAAPPPRLKGFRGQDLIDSEWFDPALGGDQVAARIKNLALAQSRLDGRVDGASGIAYLEWTLEFRNTSVREREARALIELPPGAVVSRVTLWINGEPREAAFGGRSQTRQAYQQVAVRQRRDPVLVTTAGPDRILLQCFPVPVGGTLKTRIGISAPLAVPDAEKAEAVLRLPAFVEQNFSSATKLTTTVWLESDRAALATSPGLVAVVNDDLPSIRGEIPADESASAAYLRVPLATPQPPVLAGDPRLPADTAIRQTLQPPARAPAFPRALAVVIDGSARMKAQADTLREILARIPAGTPVLYILASDVPRATEEKPSRKFLAFAGGCDNGSALVQAAQWSLEHDSAPILWLHAAQPLDSTDLEALRQIATFARGRLAIYGFQFGPGADRISEKLADLNLVHPLLVEANAPAAILDALRGSAAAWIREKVPVNGENPPVTEGSSHIVRLWAADEIARLTAPFRKSGREDALDLARTFQLVTPVSGAVVLETAAQYKANDLTPADPATTPEIVPEPGTLLLLLTGAPLLLALRRRKSA